jgi:quercetin 2,3-dioxygenase
MKQVLSVVDAPGMHWVGDGFPVRPLISPGQNKAVDPFLMLDYAAPMAFTPATHRRGVGQHPHRGFETVTVVYQGELEHRDSTGAGGKIGPGDVQWMTAAGGILHEEFHSEAFAKSGGNMEMVQLWVNLPARHKNAAAGYQTLLNAEIPSVDLPGGAGRVRVIAGEYLGRKGPARTFTPIDLWDVRLVKGKAVELSLPEGHTAALAVLHGSVHVNATQAAEAAQLVVLDRKGQTLTLSATNDATVLVLSGEPIGEPVAAHGPFVMNTIGEIKQAMLDFNNGKFGAIS